MITEEERDFLLNENELLRKNLFDIKIEMFKNKFNEEKVLELRTKENVIKKQMKLNLLKIKTYELNERERGMKK